MSEREPTAAEAILAALRQQQAKNNLLAEPPLNALGQADETRQKLADAARGAAAALKQDAEPPAA